ALDLSAIAKGHGVDRIAALLERNGLHSYLVDIGGELRVSGLNRSLALWRLAIEQPQRSTESGAAGVAALLSLTSKAVATSGDYRNFFAHEGQVYSHTIDPGTGFPAAHSLASVTVIADLAMQADAWATALMVAGPEKAMALAKQQQLAVLLLQRAHDAGDSQPPGEPWLRSEQWWRWHSAPMEKYLLGAD
ncbi:MAG: FAD:protein FMN transferase, partial [Pseudomonadales bacterium]|nr:FAD:protein FMN transferase [Pseudomonadales bacterium]